MIFYPTTIRIKSNTDEGVISKIENKFGLKIKNNIITNGVLRYYFATFCHLEEIG